MAIMTTTTTTATLMLPALSTVSNISRQQLQVGVLGPHSLRHPHTLARTWNPQRRRPIRIKSSDDKRRNDDTGSAVAWCFPDTRKETQVSESESNGSRISFFDVDGTILKSNIVVPIVIYRLYTMRNQPLFFRILWLAHFVVFKAIVYLLLDAIDRALVLPLIYRNYSGIAVEEADQIANLAFQRYLKPRIRDEARREIASRSREGYTVVMLTGGLRLLMQPLAAELGIDRIYGTDLETSGGRFTGRIVGLPLGSDGKGLAVQSITEQQSVDPNDCVAYGDSIADLGMLQAVGQRICVRPDSKLSAVAAQNGWQMVDWKDPEDSPSTIQVLKAMLFEPDEAKGNTMRR